MRTKTNIETLLVVILVIFTVGCASQHTRMRPPAAPVQKTAEQAPTTTEPLEQKLDEVAGKTTPDKKEDKNIKSALDIPSCESFTDVRDQRDCVKAQERERREITRKEREAELRRVPESMRRIREARERQERKQAKVAMEEAYAANQSQITGCDAGTVWVKPDVAPPHWVSYIWPTYVLILANQSHYLIDEIRAPTYGGMVVKRLCAGGVMQVSFTLTGVMSDYLRVPLVLIHRGPDGLSIETNYTVSLNRYNSYYSMLDGGVWGIKIQPQQQAH